MTVLALTGGVGGAKLAFGLAKLLRRAECAFVVNTGDDFEHLGFHISPDMDTLTYTLAGLASPAAGWGRRDESWAFMAALEGLGGESWFRLGDRDLALHVIRRELLASGNSLTAATAKIAARLGVRHRILPMSDDPVRTEVETAAGRLAFQHYFVRERCIPAARGFVFAGAEAAKLNPEIPWRDLHAVVLCPSNPFVSVGPMLAVPGMRDALLAARVPIVAVSPIVGGAAIKGPTAKMMRELGMPVSAEAVAEHYAGLVTHFVIDEVDRAEAPAVEALGMRVDVTQTIMRTSSDRVRLARAVLAFAA